MRQATLSQALINSDMFIACLMHYVLGLNSVVRDLSFCDSLSKQAKQCLKAAIVNHV